MAYSPAERPIRLVDAKFRKDVRPHGIRTDRIDSQYPSARIRRLKASNPLFRSNRKGWRKFYIWQARYHRQLGLKLQLGCI